MLKFLKGNIYISLVLRLLIILVIFSICRIAFYIFNIDSFTGINIQNFSRILLGGLKFDISAIFYINILFILSQLVPFHFRYSNQYQKFFAIVFFITNGIGIAFNIADIAYFPFTLKRSTFSLFSQFSNEENLGQLVIKFIFIDYWYTTILFIAMIFLMIYLYKKIKIKRAAINKPVFYYSQGIIMMLLITWCVIAGMRGGFRHSTRPITLSNAGEFVEDPVQINLVINTPFSILRTLKTKPLKKANYFIDKQALDSLYNPIKIPQIDKPFINKNIVVLIIESFSKEYIGALNKDLDNGNYKGYTPFLDSLISESLTFSNAYANGRKSIEGLPSVIASIPGINEPFILSYYSGNKFNSLGSLLGKKGYHTSFFHGAPNGSMGFSSFTKMAGIEHYYGKDEYNNNQDFDGIWGIWDEPFLQYWAKNLDTFKQPFFSTVFTLSSHHPFKVPKEYEGKFPKGTLPIHQNVGYTDMALRKFFQSVSKSPWYKNTIFVITADHSSIATHEEYKTSLGAYAVPIIFFDPSGQLKGNISTPVQQIDILPTVLNYLNFDQPYFSFGNDMLNINKHNFVINTIDGDYQIVMDDYILKANAEKTLKMYNYKKDALLKDNILGKDSENKERLELHLKAFIQQYNNHMIDNSLTVNP
jgi:phosphoglycerol transferase MdoB-like AlkP superfamily enzyme